MRRTDRRQRQLYFFTGLVAAIAITNALFFLILHRPARSEFVRLRDSVPRLRTEIASRQRQLDLKEKVGTQLEASGRDRQKLVDEHFIPIDVGFARVLPELDVIARETGVKKNRVDYTTDLALKHGLYPVKINIPVQGGYSSVVRFIRKLENSDTFYIITSVDVRSSSDKQADTLDTVSLALNLETFFYQ